MDSQGITGRTERSVKGALGKLPLSRLLIMIACALVLAIVLVTAREIAAARDSMLADSERQLEKLGMVFAEQTGHAVESVDLIIKVSLESLRPPGADDAAAGESVRAMLQRHISGVGQVSALMVVDAKGEMTHTSGVALPAGARLGDFHFFKVLAADPSAGLQVSEPIRDAAGQWGILLARRIDAAGGSFPRAKISVLDPVYFDEVYRAVDLG